jgi:hypothetical protein
MAATRKKLGLPNSTLDLMGALVRMPPKQHDEMKIGKARKQTDAKRGRRKKATR